MWICVRPPRIKCMYNLVPNKVLYVYFFIRVIYACLVHVGPHIYLTAESALIISRLPVTTP